MLEHLLIIRPRIILVRCKEEIIPKSLDMGWAKVGQTIQELRATTMTIVQELFTIQATHQLTMIINLILHTEVTVTIYIQRMCLPCEI